MPLLKRLTSKLVVNSLHLSLQGICFAQRVDKELRKAVQGPMQLVWLDIKVVCCVFLHMRGHTLRPYCLTHMQPCKVRITPAARADYMDWAICDSHTPVYLAISAL